MHISLSEGFRIFFKQLDEASCHSPFIKTKYVQLWIVMEMHTFYVWSLLVHTTDTQNPQGLFESLLQNKTIILISVLRYYQRLQIWQVLYVELFCEIRSQHLSLGHRGIKNHSRHSWNSYWQRLTLLHERCCFH